MTQPRQPAEVVDFTTASAADQRITQAVRATHRDRILADLAGLLPAAEPGTQALAKGLVDAIASLSAEVALLRERLDDADRDRDQRLRIDPLPLIPDDRQRSPDRPARHFELHATSSAFNGLGWHPVEQQGDFSWRWSGLLPHASLLLPTLGGGALRLRLDLLAPFACPLPEQPVVWINDAAMALSRTTSDARCVTYEGSVSLGEDDGYGSFTLTMPELRFSDPASGPRDSRLLGVGLHRLVLDRMPLQAGQGTGP